MNKEGMEGVVTCRQVFYVMCTSAVTDVISCRKWRAIKHLQRRLRCCQWRRRGPRSHSCSPRPAPPAPAPQCLPCSRWGLPGHPATYASFNNWAMYSTTVGWAQNTGKCIVCVKYPPFYPLPSPSWLETCKDSPLPVLRDWRLARTSPSPSFVTGDILGLPPPCPLWLETCKNSPLPVLCDWRLANIPPPRPLWLETY